MLRYIAIALLVMLACSQDALLTTNSTFNLTISQSQPFRGQYLIQLPVQRIQPHYRNLWAQYQSQNNCSIMELQFFSVLKSNPTQSVIFLRKCRFEGSSLQECDIDIYKLHIPSILIKMVLETTSACQANIVMGLGKAPSVRALYPNFQERKKQGGEKGKKIVGFLVGSFLLLVIAIRIAVWVADRNDKPPKPAKDVKYNIFKDKGQ